MRGGARASLGASLGLSLHSSPCAASLRSIPLSVSVKKTFNQWNYTHFEVRIMDGNLCTVGSPTVQYLPITGRPLYR